MRKKSFKKFNELPMSVKNIIYIFISCFIGVLIALILSYIFSFILSHSQNLSKFTGIYFITSVIIGGFFCGFIGTKLLNFKGLISGLITSFPYSSIIFLLMMLLSRKMLNWYSIIFILGIIIITTIGGIISANTKRRK